MPSNSIFRPCSPLTMELLRLMSVRRVKLRCTLAAQFDPIYCVEKEREKKTREENAAQKKTVTLIILSLHWVSVFGYGGMKDKKDRKREIYRNRLRKSHLEKAQN